MMLWVIGVQNDSQTNIMILGSFYYKFFDIDVIPVQNATSMTVMAILFINNNTYLVLAQSTNSIILGHLHASNISSKTEKGYQVGWSHSDNEESTNGDTFFLPKNFKGNGQLWELQRCLIWDRLQSQINGSH